VVGDDDIDILVADDVERLGSVRSEEELELSAERSSHRVQNALLVVDEQEPRSVCLVCCVACMG
jgi:hypothetical protein